MARGGKRGRPRVQQRSLESPIGSSILAPSNSPVVGGIEREEASSPYSPTQTGGDKTVTYEDDSSGRPKPSYAALVNPNEGTTLEFISVGERNPKEGNRGSRRKGIQEALMDIQSILLMNMGMETKVKEENMAQVVRNTCPSWHWEHNATKSEKGRILVCWQPKAYQFQVIEQLIHGRIT
ncbi:hypothetical protein Cgig2_028519 [Carnegiea gigantea]|uniref:Uncharacterized protein n=1 Tax=Carnegiea gigantea TaxID=171969 RepID=A0A9Q1GL89_9CARY|nr:hypothetical protein Cgig2_028519 [Carnegiea gigantea]